MKLTKSYLNKLIQEELQLVEQLPKPAVRQARVKPPFPKAKPAVQQVRPPKGGTPPAPMGARPRQKQQQQVSPQDLKNASLGLYQSYITSRGKKADVRGRARLADKSMPVFCALQAWSGTGEITNQVAVKVVRMATKNATSDPELFNLWLETGKKVRVDCT